VVSERDALITKESEMTTPAVRNAPPAVTYTLIGVGVLFAIVGVIYLTQTAGHLPAFLPGHTAGSAHKHLKHGLATFGVAVLSWVGAWLSTGHRRKT
jgi:O-antigen/teichoic acid export membrane protein